MRNAINDTNIVKLSNYLPFLYIDLKAKHLIQGKMFNNTDHIVSKVNDHQREEVDYADPESPTLAVPQSTSTDERCTDVVVTGNNTDTVGM